MRIQTSCLFAVLAAANTFASVSVSNLSVAQREGSREVDIHFDASNSEGSEVSVSVLISNDASPVATTSFSGDYGGSVATGSGLLVVWDGADDFPGEITSNLSITVQVADPVPAGMVHIPAGTNAGSDPDFTYNLTVSDFLMDETEVTKSRWDQHAGSLVGDSKGSDHPVHSVTWFEAVQWCNNRSDSEGLIRAYTPASWARVPGANGYRLPTEEEWQYAARGGLNGQRYPWGNEISHGEANYQSTDPDSDDTYHPDFNTGGTPYTSPAGYFEPNGFGLYDMAGNVYEWCDDRNGVLRVRKGGSCESYEIYQRCGSAEYKDNTFQSKILGFRTVRNFAAGDSQTQTISFDSRDYQLSVTSEFGTPFPMIGTSTFAWRSEVNCSVESAVSENDTNYTCIGWSGTGSVPMVGTSNEVTFVLTNLSSTLIWNWADEDSDQDGMNDEWELVFFGNLSQTQTNDFDADGQNNRSEYIAGTNPTNPASLFQLLETIEGSHLLLQWPAASNRIYNLYHTDNLQYTAFTNLESNIAFPRNSATVSPVTVRGFYKMDVRK